MCWRSSCFRPPKESICSHHCARGRKRVKPTNPCGRCQQWWKRIVHWLRILQKWSGKSHITLSAGWSNSLAAESCSRCYIDRSPKNLDNFAERVGVVCSDAKQAARLKLAIGRG